MATQDDEPIKVGGQALVDGVLMRTPRAWAIAREDGSIEVGAVAPNPFARVPVLRIVAALFSALKLGIGRGLLGRRPAGAAAITAAAAVSDPNFERSARSGGAERSKNRRRGRLNRRLLLILVGLEAAAYLFTRQAGDVAATPAAIAATTVITFAVLRLATPRSLWRYHGAEHKAVTAHENGTDLTQTADVLRAGRVHSRCGTNLVVLVLVAGLVLRDAVHGWWQLPAFLLLLGATAEIVTLAAKRPEHPLSRATLAPGKALQRWVTTSEPTAAEQAVGCVALTACLEEHARLVALDTAPAPAMAVAAA